MSDTVSVFVDHNLFDALLASLAEAKAGVPCRPEPLAAACWVLGIADRGWVITISRTAHRALLNWFDTMYAQTTSSANRRLYDLAWDTVHRAKAA